MGINTNLTTQMNFLPQKKIDKVHTLTVDLIGTKRNFWYQLNLQQWQGTMASLG